MKISFPYFLQLLRTVRDSMYDYSLPNAHRMTSQCRTYVHGLDRRDSYKRGWPWYRGFSMPVLRPPPSLHTPSILCVCSQVRREALDTLYRTKILLYRTKILVITVASTEDKLCNLDPKWLLSMSRFVRIRFDLIVACVVAETMSECFRRVASLLLHTLSLGFLEVRIRYPHADASAALRDHGFALVISREDVMRSMCELLPCLRMRVRPTGNQGTAARGPTQISWGVTETQMEAGNYSCACTYLSASCLRQAWKEVCGETEESDVDIAVQLSEQDCRHFGCMYRHQ